MKNVSISIEEFKAQYDKEYEFLYAHYDHVAGYSEAVTAFDDGMRERQWFRDFVNAFAQYRKDCISSDREAAALMFALDAMRA